MKRLLLLFSLSSPLILFSQTTWQKLFDSGDDDNISINNPQREIINTSDGGFLFTGTTDVGVNSDILLIKTNNSFDLEWQMSYDAGDRDEAFAVVEKPSGGYYLAGRTSSFDGTAHDALLIFVDAMGVLQWSKTYGNMPGLTETFTSIDIQSNGNLILAGYANELAGIGLNDNYLVVTDELGVEQWQRGFGGSAQDIGRQAIFDHDSEVLMFGGGVITGNAGLTDGYLNKFDVNGNLVWTKSYGGASADFAWGASIVKNNEGGYLLAGHTQSFGQGSQDFIAIKINSVGDTLWTRTYGGPGLEYLINAIATSDDGYLLFGYSDDFGPSTKNGIVLKIDSNGNLEWTKMYGDAAECHIMGAAESPSGYVFFSNTSGFNSVTNNIYVLKTDFNGYSGGCNESNVLLVTNNTNLSVSAPIGTYVNLSSEISRTFTETASNLSETVICFDDPTQDCFPSYVPTDSLVGWWPFCGNANDESGNGNDGVVNGATLTTDRFGNPYSAYDFDGVDDEILVLTSNVLADSTRSYSLWVKINSNLSNPYGQLLTSFNGCGCDYLSYNGNDQSYINSGTVGRFYCGKSGNLSTFAINDNQWHHIVLIHDYDDLKSFLYIDNVLNNIQLSNNFLSYTPLVDFLIGNGIGPGTTTFGILDDIGIWNRALTQCEISELYHAQQFTPPVLAVSDTTSACGASTTLDAGTDPAWASYLWNTTEDTQTISVSNSGLYTVEVTDTNGCIGYDTTLVSIIDPTIDQIDTNICIGDSLVLNVCPTGTSCMPLPQNLQNGLVAHYPFCGNANDESGNGFDGTVNGATLTTDRFCNENSAYYFDGVDDWINIGNPLGDITTDITVSIWVQDINSLGGVVIAKKPDDNWCGQAGAPYGIWQIYASSTSISFCYPSPLFCSTYGIGCTPVESGTNLLSNWVNIVLVEDGDSLYSFKNGIQTNAWLSENISQLNDIITLGRRMDNGNSYFYEGNIDDVSLWNRALTPSEIQELYELGNYDITWSTGDTTSSITVQPTTTTTYSVTVSDGISSCVDDVTITVNDPQVDAGVDVDVCNGDDITLSGTGADTYAWSGGVTDGVAFGPTVSEYYYVTGTDTLGCEDNDSVFVTMLQPTTSSITEANCDTYTAPDGQTYTTTGNYTAVIPNAVGCDSTITIDLTITNSSSSSITETVCDTYTAPDGQTYTSTGNYIAVIPNTEGCDSTITIDLIVNYSSTSSIVESVCDTYIAPDGQSYNQTGIYTSIIPNSVGCDSTITIDLTVGNSSTNSITISECDTYTAPDGQTYTSTGNYTAVIPNAVGCDSTITIDLTITNSSSSSITETVCDTYTAPDGQTYTSTGNYTAVIPNAEGCDSTITIDLTVNTLTTLDGGADISLCEGDSVILSGSGAQSYAWNNGVTDGQYFTPTVGTTTYTVTGTDVNGCEDTDDVIVSVSGTPELIITGFSPDCQGESTGSAQADVTGGISPYSFVWSNGSITSVIGGIPSGTYSVTVTDDAGCITSGEVIVTDGTDPCFFVPGGLSPNGDGNNDTWGVTGLDNYPDASVMIYNRWGQLLYDVGPDGPPWDGMYLGEELPTADYYYVIDLGNGEVYNGVVTLKR